MVLGLDVGLLMWVHKCLHHTSADVVDDPSERHFTKVQHLGCFHPNYLDIFMESDGVVIFDCCGSEYQVKMPFDTSRSQDF